MHTLDAVLEGRVDGRCLRQHAVRELALVAQLVEGGAIDVADQGLRVVDVFENARCARQQDQFFRVEFRGDSRGDRVGVDVQQRAGLVAGQRADHRHQAVVELFLQDVGVDGVDVAHEPVIDRVVAVALDGRAPMRADQAGVDTADADRRYLQVAARRQDPRVDLAVQNHRRDV